MSKIILLEEGAIILNKRNSEFNRKFSKNLRTNFEAGEEIDSVYGGVIMGFDMEPTDSDVLKSSTELLNATEQARQETIDKACEFLTPNRLHYENK